MLIATQSVVRDIGHRPDVILFPIVAAMTHVFVAVTSAAGRLLKCFAHVRNWVAVGLAQVCTVYRDRK